MSDPATIGGTAAEAVSPAEARFDRYRRIVGAIAAPLAFGAVYALAGGLSPRGRTLAAILSATGVLWMTETLALPITALLGATLCVVLGVADVRTVLAPFADPIVFLFIGSFMLARAMSLHALDRRLALGFLSWPWIAAHPARVMAGLGLVTAVISMWVSNTATAAMMLPIALGILASLQEVRADGQATRSLANWPYATGMMLMVSFSASIGGIATPVGTPPNLIGLGFIERLAGVRISFFGWMAMAMPIFAVMAAALFVLLYALHPAPRGSLRMDNLRQYLDEQRRQLGPWSAGQINTLAVFLIAFALWTLPGAIGLFVKGHHASLAWINARFPEAVVAMIAGLLLFILPTNLRRGQFTLTWKEAAKIDWGTILLFGGGLSLGGLMFQTGVANALGEKVTSLTGASTLWTLTAVSIAMAIFLSEATSNTAAANMVLPVVIVLAQKSGINPLPPALGACLGASFGFMLPVSTPPNAIVYGSGLVPIPKMVRAGILFDLLGFVLIWCGLRVLWGVFHFGS